jgi:hypothetical protein
MRPLKSHFPENALPTLETVLKQTQEACLADTSRLLYPSCSVLELESETRLASMLILTL